MGDHRNPNDGDPEAPAIDTGRDANRPKAPVDSVATAGPNDHSATTRGPAQQVVAWIGALISPAMVAIPFAIAYCLLFRLLPDSIASWEKLRPWLDASTLDDGGIPTLFILTSGIFGWSTVAIISRHISIARIAMFAIAIPIWAVGMASGFYAGLAGQPGLESAAIDLLLMSALCVAGVGALRAYVDDHV